MALNGDNNSNNVDDDIDGDGTGSETVTLQDHPALERIRNFQLAYVRKVVDTVNDLDNVLFEIINEGGTKAWDWFLVRFVQDYEKRKPKQHPIGLTGHGGEDNESMIASPAQWFSLGAREWSDLATNPRVADGRKVSLLDTDHIWGEGGDYRWVWKSFLRGDNPIYTDRLADLTADPRGDIPGAKEVRKAMGHTLTMAHRVRLANMTPHTELASTFYCLAEFESEYLIYLPDGGREVTVDLTAPPGTIAVEWMHPVTGELTLGPSVTGGSLPRFKSPVAGDVVLHLWRQ
ncbi:MAG: hypothetical protein NZ959_00870 [Armatimonadetes bacterium]|nr:hypothetical protein [Armatimonadota bacterium]MDW8121060.1 hypothetical protein [Armatimonadota bacterium]